MQLNLLPENGWGSDALDQGFDFDASKTAMLGIKRDVKSVLMDQKIIKMSFSDDARMNPAEQIDKFAPSQLKHLFVAMCYRNCPPR